MPTRRYKAEPGLIRRLQQDPQLQRALGVGLVDAQGVLPGAPIPGASLPGVGAAFHRRLVDRYGIEPCQRCVEMIDEMDRLGPEGCRQRRDELLDGIWQRRHMLRGWRAIAARLPGAKHVAVRELGQLLDAAVEEVAASAMPPPTPS